MLQIVGTVLHPKLSITDNWLKIYSAMICVLNYIFAYYVEFINAIDYLIVVFNWVMHFQTKIYLVKQKVFVEYK